MGINFNNAEAMVKKQKANLPLVRVDGKEVNGYFLNEKPVIVETHYVNGRTQPHLDNGECIGCEKKRERRPRGYIALYNEKRPGGSKIFTIEFTPVAYQGIQESIKNYGRLRGNWGRFNRKSGKKASALICEVVEANKDLETLPKAPDLIAFLCLLWNIDSHLVNKTGDDLSDFVKANEEAQVDIDFQLWLAEWESLTENEQRPIIEQVRRSYKLAKKLAKAQLDERCARILQKRWRSEWESLTEVQKLPIIEEVLNSTPLGSRLEKKQRDEHCALVLRARSKTPRINGTGTDI